MALAFLIVVLLFVIALIVAFVFPPQRFAEFFTTRNTTDNRNTTDKKK